MNDTTVLTARAWASGSFATISANLFVKFTIFYTNSSEVNVLGNANRFIGSAWLIWTVGWKWNLLALTVSVQLQPGIPMVVFGSGASKTRRVVPRKTLTQVRITFRLIGVVTAVLEINRNYHMHLWILFRYWRWWPWCRELHWNCGCAQWSNAWNCFIFRLILCYLKGV